MCELFVQDKNRFEYFSIELNRFLIDYSKNLVTEETMQCLFDLAKETNVEKQLIEKIA